MSTVTVPTDLRSLLTLQLVPGLGPRLTTALLERFGSANAVLQARPEQLAEVPHIGAKLARDFHEAMRRADLDSELAALDRYEVHLLALGATGYPGSLANIPDPPHLLYVRGKLDARDAHAVAIVGSRHGSSYGRRAAENLATGLARAGFTVVSGLARGVDGAAHRGALKAGGRTLAVLAGGLSRIYPPEHAELADEVRASGALLSEAAMHLEPMAGMFPARNRIISGLSRAVIIVEAAERSGALITASHAAEQGRTVFAVPGPIDSAASGGTNALIRKGAILCRGVEDVLEELEGVRTDGAVVCSVTPPADLDDGQRRIWDFLAEGPRHTDEITRHLGVSVAEVTRSLMLLEMRKVLRRLPGNQYERR